MVACLVAVGSFGATAAAWAQTPPLHLVVPVAPGGSSDLVARLLAERLAERLGRRVVVENRPGATGRIAIDAFLALPPADALLIAPMAVVVTAPLVYREWPYSPRDLAPVTRLATFDYAFAVGTAFAARTFPEFAAWARQQAGGTNFAATGTGSIPHLAGLAIAKTTGFAATLVAYASIGRLEADLAGGHVASAVGATSDLLPLHRAGRIRILATSGATRSPGLPAVPTFAELGYPQLAIEGWTAAFASAHLTSADVERLSGVINEALHDPNVVAQLRAHDLQAAGTTAGELAQIIARDIAYWAPRVRDAGIVRDGVTATPPGSGAREPAEERPRGGGSAP